MNTDINTILESIKEHSQYRRECLNFIASENAMSPITRSVLSSDLANRYTVGSLNSRWYAGCRYYDTVEKTAINRAKKLLHAKYVNVQPVSGMVANLVAYYALLKPGDTIMTHQVKHSGHYSHVKSGMLSLFQVNVESIPFDEENYSLDIEKTIEKIQSIKPNVILLGTTEFLFPAPIKELRKVCDKTNTKILYDAAHVSGLIAGQTFQDPLPEGTDLLSMSTNKTLSAPDHGLVACNNPDLYQKQIEYALVPMFTSNHHAHHIAGLAVTLAEFDQFGHEYATQVIKNAKALARELYKRDVAVLCPQKDFTESHTVLLDAKTDANKAVKLLENAQIITNAFRLPWNKVNHPTGIRLGTSELTRFYMREPEMKIMARFIADTLFERQPVEKARQQVRDFRRNFQEISYCFSDNYLQN